MLNLLILTFTVIMFFAFVLFFVGKIDTHGDESDGKNCSCCSAVSTCKMNKRKL